MSDDMIQRAAKAMQDELDRPRYRYDEAGEPYGAAEQLARALADEGLLAPDMREEWGVYLDGDGPLETFDTLYAAQSFAYSEETIRRRHVTEWETP